jgi:hypothetical protein
MSKSKSEFWGNVFGVVTAAATAPLVAAVSAVDAVVEKKSFGKAWKDNEPGLEDVVNKAYEIGEEHGGTINHVIAHGAKHLVGGK